MYRLQDMHPFTFKILTFVSLSTAAGIRAVDMLVDGVRLLHYLSIDVVVTLCVVLRVFASDKVP